MLTTATAQRGQLLLLALVVVAGLLGMHGLGEHRLGGQGLAVGHAQAAASSMMPAAMAAVRTPVAAAHATGGSPVLAAPSVEGGNHRSLAMVCVAALTAISSIVLLLRRLPRRPWRSPRIRLGSHDRSGFRPLMTRARPLLGTVCVLRT